MLPRKESSTVEFKTAFDKETIETLCAFANAKGRSVYLGIDDSGKAVGVTLGKETVQQWINQIKLSTTPSLLPDIHIEKSAGRIYVELIIPDYPVKPVSYKGKYLKRINTANHTMSLQEISDLYLQTTNTSWDNYPSSDKNLNHISLEKVNQFIARANSFRDNPITDDPLTVLRKYDLINSENISHACFLLFTAQEQYKCSIQIGLFADEITIKDDITVRSDLFSQVKETMSAVKKHINKKLVITGNPQHSEVWEYPLEALREIIINMIVHRNYQDHGDSIIKVFNDRIEFFNPGCLLQGLTVHQLLSGHYTSHIRNKKIASLFKDAGIIEQYGSGISRIIKMFADNEYKQPLFENFGHGFRVTVYNKNPIAKARVTDNVTDNSERRRMKIVEIIRKQPLISSSNLA
ncbi:MAG: AAA family ATPase [Chitinivibrionales bacterium]|nr:AAA family ATPase [Chitinivibrionales bacterium]